MTYINAESYKRINAVYRLCVACINADADERQLISSSIHRTYNSIAADVQSVIALSDISNAVQAGRSIDSLLAGLRIKAEKRA